MRRTTRSSPPASCPPGLLSPNLSPTEFATDRTPAAPVQAAALLPPIKAVSAEGRQVRPAPRQHFTHRPGHRTPAGERRQPDHRHRPGPGPRALAHVDQAVALRLPTLSGGGIYTRHDGITQRQDGSPQTTAFQRPT